MVSELDELLDADIGDDYCPNGLQVEGRREVRRVVTAVSASRALLTRAVDHEADAVLVHHGLLWNSARPPCLVGSFRERVRLLLANDISLIAYHLPLDRHPELGNAAQLARRLGLEGLEPFGWHGGAPLGVCGVFPSPIAADDLFAAVTDTCDREPLVFEGNRSRVSAVGIVTGAAQGEYHTAVAAGLDAFITGEATEWVMQQVAEDGVHYIAAGHYATERFGVQAVGRWLAREHEMAVEFIDLVNPV